MEAVFIEQHDQVFRTEVDLECKSALFDRLFIPEGLFVYQFVQDGGVEDALPAGRFDGGEFDNGGDGREQPLPAPLQTVSFARVPLELSVKLVPPTAVTVLKVAGDCAP